MALFTGKVREGYPAEQMPKPATGNGPWGEAISYCLDKRRWRQADLVRAAQAIDPKKSKNTISTATRGLDCNTNTLRVIAAALEVALDEVLVSPARKSAQDRRRQMILDITEQVVRRVDATEGAGPQHTGTIEAQTEEFAARLLAEQERLNNERFSRENRQKKLNVGKRRKK
jgi:hypothetical protein